MKISTYSPKLIFSRNPYTKLFNFSY